MDQILGAILTSLLAGFILGPLARLLLPGKQDVSIGMTVLLGAIGALVGGVAYVALGGENTPGPDWVQVLIQIVMAAAAVVIYLKIRGRPASK